MLALRIVWIPCTLHICDCKESLTLKQCYAYSRPYRHGEKYGKMMKRGRHRFVDRNFISAYALSHSVSKKHKEA